MSLPQSPDRKQLLQARARFMRHNPTYSEMLLWSAIRGKRLGVQFRRQQVIGNHIVDFLCRPAALVVEVDGDIYHAQQVALDARRDAKLRRAGFGCCVFRLPSWKTTWRRQWRSCGRLCGGSEIVHGIIQPPWYTEAMDDQALLEHALALPQEARAKLVGKLLSSLDDDAPDVDAAEAWTQVIKQRIDEIDSGIVEPITRDAFAAQLNAAVHGKNT